MTMEPTTAPRLGAVQGGTVPLQRISIYACPRWLYVVGLCRLSRRYSVLRLGREFHGATLQAVEEPGLLTHAELNVLLRSINASETSSGNGGLQLVVQAHGIVGCFRLTDSYYIMLITGKSYVGSICGHKVYKIDAVALLPLAAAVSGGASLKPQYEAASEKRYRKILMGVDLTKNFYFSYTYCLADTLQANCLPVTCRSEDAAAAAATAAAAAAGGTGGSSSSSWGQRPGVFDSMYVWNSHLASALRSAVGHSNWVVPIIHGYWEQCLVSVFGRTLSLTLLARRSRHFAGTRYRKRGITDTGRVANEVEVEQIVDVGRDWRTGKPQISSLVQLRGSVPLFWGQATSSLSPKPDIVLHHFDPLYEVTDLHFTDLRRRYGNPLVVLNLLKSRERVPRETLLRRGLAHAIGVLNAKAPTPNERAIYIPFDFAKHAKQSGANMLLEMACITSLVLNVTGFFLHCPGRRTHHRLDLSPSNLPLGCPPSSLVTYGDGASSTTTISSVGGNIAAGGTAAGGTAANTQDDRRGSQEGAWQPLAFGGSAGITDDAGGGSGRDALQLPLLRSSLPAGQPLSPFRLQHGVIRTNCIDCLDRTNVAQFAIGLQAFARQLYDLGISDSPEADEESSISFVLMGMYEAMGNTLAQQYGGSEAHSSFFQRRKGEWEAAMQGKDLVTSMRRMYSNAYTDSEKQDAMNLFLGNFVPHAGQAHLWELETDYYLHAASWSPPTLATCGSLGRFDSVVPGAVPLSVIVQAQRQQLKQQELQQRQQQQQLLQEQQQRRASQEQARERQHRREQQRRQQLQQQQQQQQPSAAVAGSQELKEPLLPLADGPEGSAASGARLAEDEASHDADGRTRTVAPSSTSSRSATRCSSRSSLALSPSASYGSLAVLQKPSTAAAAGAATAVGAVAKHKRSKRISMGEGGGAPQTAADAQSSRTGLQRHKSAGHEAQSSKAGSRQHEVGGDEVRRRRQSTSTASVAIPVPSASLRRTSWKDVPPQPPAVELASYVAERLSFSDASSLQADCDASLLTAALAAKLFDRTALINSMPSLSSSDDEILNQLDDDDGDDGMDKDDNYPDALLLSGRRVSREHPAGAGATAAAGGGGGFLAQIFGRPRGRSLNERDDGGASGGGGGGAAAGLIIGTRTPLRLSKGGPGGGGGGGGGSGSKAGLMDGAASSMWDLLALFGGSSARRGSLEQRPVASVADVGHRLTFLDDMIAREPRMIGNVRLYGSRSTGQSSLMWSALQNAFTFYTAQNMSSAPPGAAAVAAAAAPPASPYRPASTTASVALNATAVASGRASLSPRGGASSASPLVASAASFAYSIMRTPAKMLSSLSFIGAPAMYDHPLQPSCETPTGAVSGSLEASSLSRPAVHTSAHASPEKPLVGILNQQQQQQQQQQHGMLRLQSSAQAMEFEQHLLEAWSDEEGQASMLDVSYAGGGSLLDDLVLGSTAAGLGLRPEVLSWWARPPPTPDTQLPLHATAASGSSVHAPHAPSVPSAVPPATLSAASHHSQHHPPSSDAHSSIAASGAAGVSSTLPPPFTGQENAAEAVAGTTTMVDWDLSMPAATAADPVATAWDHWSLAEATARQAYRQYGQYGQYHDADVLSCASFATLRDEEDLREVYAELCTAC